MALGDFILSKQFFTRMNAKLRLIDKPTEKEYAPYTIIYIGLLPNDGQVLQHLIDNLRSTTDLIKDLPEERLTHRYAAGKWTIKEILAHIVDDERIYSYRALRFARNDKTELPGFDQDEFAHFSGANDRKINDILDEFASVRRSTVTLFNSFDDDALLRFGIASGNIMSVRAAAYHIAGHELRHLNIIKERYL